MATALHAEALAIAPPAMRLYTPSDNTRARRFYEREGWTAAGNSRHAELGIELTEYRRDL